MRIAVDARSLEEEIRTGVARYLSNILRELALLETEDDFLLLFQNKVADDAILSQKCFHKRLVKVPFPPRKKVPWEQIWLPRYLQRIDVDLLFSPSYSAPIFSPVETVVTVHDITYEVNPKWFHPKERIKMRTLTRVAAKRADHIIAVSESTKRDLVDYYKISSDKISVIYEASNEKFKPAVVERNRIVNKYKLNNNFFLYVGSFFARRNIPVLIEAFQYVREEVPDVELLLIGQDRSYPPLKLNQLLTGKGLNEKVKWIEYVSEADLVTLYNLASAFVYPSSYEGFGLPVLEAMSCGTPVITGDRSSLPEVVGKSGLLVEPTDARAFAAAMIGILKNEELRRNLSEKGMERAKKFSWRRAAEETLEVFKRVAESGER